MSYDVIALIEFLNFVFNDVFTVRVGVFVCLFVFVSPLSFTLI